MIKNIVFITVQYALISYKIGGKTLTLAPKYLLEKLWQFCFQFLKLSQYNCLFFVIFGIQDKLLLCPASEYTVRIKSK